MATDPPSASEPAVAGSAPAGADPEPDPAAVARQGPEQTVDGAAREATSREASAPPARTGPFVRALPPAEATLGRDLAFERMLFFSDAVFAIAITLLVIDLRPPAIAAADLDSGLLQALAGQSGRLLSFLLSFVVIGLYWESHLRIFRAVRTLDRRLIILNVAFLFWIAFMPYPTSILGGNPPHSSTVILYAGVQVLASFTQAALWAYPARNPTMMWPQIDRKITRHVTAQMLRTPAVFAVSIPLAVVNPWLGIASWALLVPASILIDRHFGGAPA